MLPHVANVGVPLRSTPAKLDHPGVPCNHKGPDKKRQGSERNEKRLPGGSEDERCPPKELRWPLEARKGKEMDIPSRTPKMDRSPANPDGSPVRPKCGLVASKTTRA